MINLSSIKLNLTNPRIIRNERFKQLVQSLKDFPKMMELRPIVVDDNGVIQGGNMRYKALQELKYKEIPEAWVKQARDFTTDELREFVIKDNIPFGEWDWQLLQSDWDKESLIEWGLELNFFEPVNREKEVDENIETDHECPKCGYKW